MNEGKKFEADFQDSVKKTNNFIYRLRDGTASFNKQEENSTVRFQATNICDFIAYINKKLWLLELKSIGTKSFAFSLIRESQSKNLEKIDYEGVNAGYIINFRFNNTTVYIPVKEMVRIKETINKKSFNFDDLKNYNVKYIEGKIKKVRYTYSIDIFLEG